MRLDIEEGKGNRAVVGSGVILEDGFTLKTASQQREFRRRGFRAQSSAVVHGKAWDLVWDVDNLVDAGYGQLCKLC